MSEQTYGQDATGLREAAAEVSRARESGQGGTENVSLVAEDHHKAEEPAVDPRLEDENRLSVREAGKELAEKRRKEIEGDEEFRRALGEIPPQEEPYEEYQRGVAMEDLVDAKQSYDTELNRLKEINDNLEKRQAEITAEMQRSQANAAYREQMLAQITQQATGNQIENYRQAKLAEFIQSYPELMTDQGLQELAKTNPYRYAEATKDWERANNDYLAARYQVEHTQSAVAQQQQAAFQQYAQAEDQAFFDAHPEFHGEAGKKALAKVAEAAVAEMNEKFGYSREEITRQYNTDPTMRNRAAQEAAIALGRDRLNRLALKEKRYVRPLPPVQRPGSADTVPKVSEQRMAQLTRDLSEKQSVRAAAKLLAERRRAR